MNEDNKKVECVECGNVHEWGDRKKVYDEEFCWTYMYCPVCGEESYYPVNEEQPS